MEDLNDRITYEDRLLRVIDVMNKEGRVKARLIIVKNAWGRETHKYQEVFQGKGLKDPKEAEDYGEDD